MIILPHERRRLRKKMEKRRKILSGEPWLTQTAPVRRLTKRLLAMGYKLNEGVTLDDVVLVRANHGLEGETRGFQLSAWQNGGYTFAFQDVFTAYERLYIVNQSQSLYVTEDGELCIDYEKGKRIKGEPTSDERYTSRGD